MGGADDFVVLPALAVTVLPSSVLTGDDAITVREIVDDTVEEGETVKEMAHVFLPPPTTIRLARSHAPHGRQMAMQKFEKSRSVPRPSCARGRSDKVIVVAIVLPSP
jgi:hypothetical protein